jgi:predicted nucleotidyltransferase component of viral defense system
MANKKRTLSAQDESYLRGVLQTATLAALMDSRRWEPGDLAFQGGTSLHLAHGSVRFSEDLDFMVCGGLPLKGLSREVRKHLRLPPDVAADLTVSVSPIKDVRNPHSFYVTLSGPQVIGSAKVKIELWQTPAAALHALTLKVSTISSTTGQVFVPTLTLGEIFADKVYALGARDRIKPRDVFDLWWLCEQGATAPSTELLRTRLNIYPVPSGDPSDTAKAWIKSADARLAELQAPGAADRVALDLKRWLPSSWPIDAAIAAAMLVRAIEQLQTGIGIMRSAAAQASHG